MILIIVSILLAISVIALGFSVYLNIKLGKTLLVIEQQVEESLDILDENYARIHDITQIPVLVDEPIIRNVLYHISLAKNAILEVATKLVIFEKTDTNEDSDDDQG